MERTRTIRYWLVAAAMSFAVPVAASAMVPATSTPAAAPVSGAPGSTAEGMALADAMNIELAPTDTSGDSNLSFNGYLSAANDNWFRYLDMGHNRLNLQFVLGSTANFGQSVSLYTRFLTDYANGLGNSPAYSNVGSGTKTVTSGSYSSTTPVSSSSYGWGTLASDAKVLGDFPLTSFAIGMHIKVCNTVGIDFGVLDFVSPLPGVNYTFSSSAPSGSSASTTISGIGLTNTAEGYGQVSINDTWMGVLAMHPYLYAGFDYNYEYLGNTTPSTSGTGEYIEVGLRPTYTLPGLKFMGINPFASSSFIFNQMRAETNGTESSGYLGSTVGLSLNFSLTKAMHVPHRDGDLSLGVYGEEVLASNRFVDTMYGSNVHSDSTVGGVYLAFGLR